MFSSSIDLVSSLIYTLKNIFYTYDWAVDFKYESITYEGGFSIRALWLIYLSSSFGNRKKCFWSIPLWLLHAGAAQYTRLFAPLLELISVLNVNTPVHNIFTETHWLIVYKIVHPMTRQVDVFPTKYRDKDFWELPWRSAWFKQWQSSFLQCFLAS